MRAGLWCCCRIARRLGRAFVRPINHPFNRPDKWVKPPSWPSFASVRPGRGESATLREQVVTERGRADRAEAERDAARVEREATKVAAATAEGEAKGLREALAEARRPFWRRWLG
jgi:hypothetical protein